MKIVQHIQKNRNKIELHLIGHLQSNKVRKAVDLFDVIQTVDSINLAKKIDSICKESRKKQNLYLQINTGEDPKKHGISTKNARSAAMEISKMENITLDGIMTIPPQNLSIKELRSIYCKTRKIRDEICTNINNKCKNPIIIKRDYSNLSTSDLQLYSSTDIGGCLVDGLGDGLYSPVSSIATTASKI